MNQTQLKKDLKELFKSMDFVSNKFLHDKTIGEKEIEIYSAIYQQLGMAWEFLGLQCTHHEGYKKTREKKKPASCVAKSKALKNSIICFLIMALRSWANG